MRYINKEYGFTFRPPYFNKFCEESEKGATPKAHNFANKFTVGAGLDYSSPNGAIIACKNGAVWGIRVDFYKGKKLSQSSDFINNFQAGQSFYDGSYWSALCGSLSLKWAAYNQNGLIGEISSTKKLKIRVSCYSCFNLPAELTAENSYIKGCAPFVATFLGDVSHNQSHSIYKNRYLAISQNPAEKEYFTAHFYSKPQKSYSQAGYTVSEFVLDKNQPKVYFCAAGGDQKIFAADVPSVEMVQNIFEAYGTKYALERICGKGTLGAPAENLCNFVMQSRLYYPYFNDIIFSPKRTFLDNYFNLFGIEENCAAILGAAVCGANAAKGQLVYTAEDAIMSAFSLWNIFAQIENKEDALKVYKKYVKLFAPSDDKLVICNQKTKNEIAFKWEDSPLKERQNQTATYSLDLSCLKLLTFDIMERICLLFDLPEMSSYGQAKQNLKSLINKNLWNDKMGLYANRYITGDFSQNVGATSFYPLIAGAVDDPKRLAALINNLVNPKKFWGKYAVPTLSKDNAQYGKKQDKKEKYFEYRGAIVPYVNYLVYQGLVRYGLDDIAAQLALKSSSLWQSAHSKKAVKSYGFYRPDGKKHKTNKYACSNGALLALIGIEELVGLEYFRNDLKPALRFGSFASGTNALENLRLAGNKYSIRIEDNSTELFQNEQRIFYAQGGKCAIRHFVQSENSCQFLIDARASLDITICFAQSKKAEVFLSVDSGKSRVLIQDQEVEIESLQKA